MKISFPLASLLFLTCSSAAMAQYAAPWCVTNQNFPPQCLYYDPHECQVRAGQLGGVCVGNPETTPVRAGLGQYCLVVAGARPACDYVDEDQCNAQAAQLKGACILASEASGPNLAPNPFRQVTPNLPAGTGCVTPPAINAATQLETACPTLLRPTRGTPNTAPETQPPPG
jgi:hypothetical protein